MTEGLVHSSRQHTLRRSLPAGPEAFDGGSSGKNPLERPLAALFRYKWLIAALVILASGAGVVASRMVDPQYEVRATVWVTTATPQSQQRVGPIRSGELLQNSAWIELFRSYRIVDEVVRKLTLYLEPADESTRPLFAGFQLANRFAPGSYELIIDKPAKTWVLTGLTNIEVERGTATDSVGRKVGFQWLLPASAFTGTGVTKVAFAVNIPRDVSIRLLDQLGNRMQDESNFLWLTYGSSNPHLAARTLNTWLDEYIRVAAELKKRNVTEFADILERQLQYAERATQEAETAYQRFRVNTITLPTEGGPVAAGAGGAGPEATRDPAIQSFFEQKIQYDNLRHDREALEKSIATAAQGNGPYEGLLLIPSVAQSPGADALREAFRNQYQLQARLVAERQNFTDEYPTVRELKGALDILQTQTIPNLASQLLAQLRDRERDYERRIAGAGRELQEIPPRTIEERRLHRAVVVAEGLYTNLKARYAEARLAEASATPDVSVLDTAVAPLSPSRNSAPMLILLAVVGGFGVAVGLALLLDMMDKRLRYSDQALNELGLVIGGAIPRVPKGGMNSRSPEQVLQFVEAFRSLRMHVRHMLPGPSVSFAVTSAAPSDGKSLVAANLAFSFAESGMRTVLVDGDTRRGSLHKMFGLEAAGGLTEYLCGLLGEDEVVRATSHDNLSLVSCGLRNARSPELVASPRMKQLLDALATRFDVVIVDTPPLAAGIDGYAISAAAGSVLMVLRIGQTERRLAAAKLSVLDRLPVDVLGAVLNGVELKGEFQYYGYSSGYGISENESAGELAASAN